jgi:hypothetical protein
VSVWLLFCGTELALAREDNAKVIARLQADKRKKLGINNSSYVIKHNQWVAGCLGVKIFGGWRIIRNGFGVVNAI